MPLNASPAPEPAVGAAEKIQIRIRCRNADRGVGAQLCTATNTGNGPVVIQDGIGRAADRRRVGLTIRHGLTASAGDAEPAEIAANIDALGSRAGLDSQTLQPVDRRTVVQCRAPGRRTEAGAADGRAASDPGRRGIGHLEVVDRPAISRFVAVEAALA